MPILNRKVFYSMKSIFLFLCIFLFSGCQSPDYRSIPVPIPTKLPPIPKIDIKLPKSISNPFSFSKKRVKKEYYTGGKIRSKFVMSDQSGQNGVLKKYGYDGILTSVTQIRGGVPEGYEALYDKNGHILMKTPYINGQKNGIQRSYYPNGDTMITTTYVNNMKHGKAIAYTQDGRIYKQAIFSHGKLISQE